MLVLSHQFAMADGLEAAHVEDLSVRGVFCPRAKEGISGVVDDPNGAFRSEREEPEGIVSAVTAAQAHLSRSVIRAVGGIRWHS